MVSVFDTLPISLTSTHVTNGFGDNFNKADDDDDVRMFFGVM